MELISTHTDATICLFLLWQPFVIYAFVSERKKAFAKLEKKGGDGIVQISRGWSVSEKRYKQTLIAAMATLFLIFGVVELG
jgi:hypothetical protein